jgi:hypothetical protein
MTEKDHPELDLSEEIDGEGIKQYISLIGSLERLVTLGRFDIQVGVATMRSVCASPRVGHLGRLKRIYGYIKRNPDGAILFRVCIPDHDSHGTPIKYDLTSSINGNLKE